MISSQNCQNYNLTFHCPAIFGTCLPITITLISHQAYQLPRKPGICQVLAPFCQENFQNAKMLGFARICSSCPSYASYIFSSPRVGVRQLADKQGVPKGQVGMPPPPNGFQSKFIIFYSENLIFLAEILNFSRLRRLSAPQKFSYKFCPLCPPYAAEYIKHL